MSIESDHPVSPKTIGDIRILTIIVRHISSTSVDRNNVRSATDLPRDFALKAVVRLLGSETFTVSRT